MRSLDFGCKRESARRATSIAEFADVLDVEWVTGDRRRPSWAQRTPLASGSMARCQTGGPSPSAAFQTASTAIKVGKVFEQENPGRLGPSPA